VEDQSAKGDRESNPRGTPEECLADTDLMRAAVKDSQVQNHRKQHEEIKFDPVNWRVHHSVKIRFS
jgi:hypothetical protein